MYICSIFYVLSVLLSGIHFSEHYHFICFQIFCICVCLSIVRFFSISTFHIIWLQRFFMLGLRIGQSQVTRGNKSSIGWNNVTTSSTSDIGRNQVARGNKSNIGWNNVTTSSTSDIGRNNVTTSSTSDIGRNHVTTSSTSDIGRNQVTRDNKSNIDWNNVTTSSTSDIGRNQVAMSSTNYIGSSAYCSNVNVTSKVNFIICCSVLLYLNDYPQMLMLARV